MPCLEKLHLTSILLLRLLSSRFSTGLFSVRLDPVLRFLLSPVVSCRRTTTAGTSSSSIFLESWWGAFSGSGIAPLLTDKYNPTLNKNYEMFHSVFAKTLITIIIEWRWWTIKITCSQQLWFHSSVCTNIIRIISVYFDIHTPTSNVPQL